MPVLLVHGLDQGPGIFQPLLASLQANGYSSECLHALALKPANGSNRAAAEEQIALAVEQLLRAGSIAEENAPARVHVIAHSMGALSARWYAAFVRPDRVATVITTSGANHGTDWECGRPFGAGHREMCPAFASEAESFLQARLNGTPNAARDETPFGLGLDSPGRPPVPADARRSILFVTLRAPVDPYVVPAESLVLDGAGDPALRIVAPRAVETSPGNFLLTDAAGHDELLANEAAHELILRILQAREAQLPR